MENTIPVTFLLDDIRSLYNVGSFFRVADGAGLEKLYLCGITGYPERENDSRKPWEIESVSKKIHKTALGAENAVAWEYVESPSEIVNELHNDGYQVVAVETDVSNTTLYSATFEQPVVFIFGNERDGISKDVLTLSDKQVSIPMCGKKGSLNVTTSGAVIAYEMVRRLLLS